MASWREFFGGEYLNLEKVGSRTITDVISEIGTSKNQTGMFKSNKERPYAVLEKEKKRVTLNQESCQSLDAKFGDDMGDWVGKKIKIKAGKVKGPSNKLVDALVVSPA